MTRRRRSSPQAALRVERQREAEIGVEGALVELVEQHRRDALERRIVEDHAGEHALGDDLDARPAPILEPSRTRKPTVSPTSSPSVRPCAPLPPARRAGAARAGSACGPRPRARRGATSGTRVVLPAPGGATSTAFGRARKRGAELGQDGVDREGVSKARIAAVMADQAGSRAARARRQSPVLDHRSLACRARANCRDARRDCRSVPACGQSVAARSTSRRSGIGRLRKRSLGQTADAS